MSNSMTELPLLPTVVEWIVSQSAVGQDFLARLPDFDVDPETFELASEALEGIKEEAVWDCWERGMRDLSRILREVGEVAERSCALTDGTDMWEHTHLGRDSVMCSCDRCVLDLGDPDDPGEMSLWVPSLDGSGRMELLAPSNDLIDLGGFDFDVLGSDDPDDLGPDDLPLKAYPIW